ncbi:protease modulator HflC [Sphingorhabdus arenilitoris]|uniref:Protein HflC n=1 Tax=Sphingorhabdus arenilitoris TaxID=1490041 RepID=A0ABV8RJJ3_9SPHN
MDRNIMKNPIALALGALALVVLSSMTVSVVPETKQAIVTSFGEPKRIVNAYKENENFGSTNAGLTFRIPFVEQIQEIDKRVLSVQMEPQEVLSTDQLQVQVNAFARYRITKPLMMYKSVRTEAALNLRLAETLGSSLRNELGRRSFDTLLSAERGQVMQNIETQLNREARKYGATVIDVRIKRADLPTGTPLDSAYERMRSAREQERATIQAEGLKEAQIIRAEANAEAARIYAESYGKDAQFYDFYRAMQSYRQTFLSPDAETNMILSPNNDYLRKFKEGQ